MTSRLDPTHNRADLIFNMSCCSWHQLYQMLGQAMTGASGYRQEDVEAGIFEKIYLPLFQNGRIVKLSFLPDTPTAVRERVVQIHAEVCGRWGCDPSWDWDPKA